MTQPNEQDQPMDHEALRKKLAELDALREQVAAQLASLEPGSPDVSGPASAVAQTAANFVAAGAPSLPHVLDARTAAQSLLGIQVSRPISEREHKEMEERQKLAAARDVLVGSLRQAGTRGRSAEECRGALAVELNATPADAQRWFANLSRNLAGIRKAGQRYFWEGDGTT